MRARSEDPQRDDGFAPEPQSARERRSPGDARIGKGLEDVPEKDVTLVAAQRTLEQSEREPRWLG